VVVPDGFLHVDCTSAVNSVIVGALEVNLDVNLDADLVNVLKFIFDSFVDGGSQRFLPNFCFSRLGSHIVFDCLRKSNLSPHYLAIMIKYGIVLSRLP
jgi:hypothetical protein